MQIIKAIPSDHLVLTEITMKSKAHWDYSEEQLFSWTDELTITANYIEENIVFKLIENEKIIGYYSICKVSNSKAELDNLFVLPDYIGKGNGKVLLSHALKHLRDQNYSEVILYSDPNSTSFYSKNGFTIIDKKESSVKGRYLPIMHRILSNY